jgi:hypothetical protein
MHLLRSMRRVGLGVTVLVALCGSQGCTTLEARASGPVHAVGLYLLDRVADGLEVVDVGISISTRPQWSFYGDFASVAGGGYGRVDGYMLGVGGGRLGLVRHAQGSIGLVAWGYEEVGWGSFDPADVTTLNYQGVGPVGLVLPPYGRPASAPA